MRQRIERMLPQRVVRKGFAKQKARSPRVVIEKAGRTIECGIALWFHTLFVSHRTGDSLLQLFDGPVENREKQGVTVGEALVEVSRRETGCPRDCSHGERGHAFVSHEFEGSVE